MGEGTMRPLHLVAGVPLTWLGIYITAHAPTIGLFVADLLFFVGGGLYVCAFGLGLDRRLRR